jgi:hypothetical protein
MAVNPRVPDDPHHTPDPHRNDATQVVPRVDPAKDELSSTLIMPRRERPDAAAARPTWAVDPSDAAGRVAVTAGPAARPAWAAERPAWQAVEPGDAGRQSRRLRRRRTVSMALAATGLIVVVSGAWALLRSETGDPTFAGAVPAAPAVASPAGSAPAAGVAPLAPIGAGPPETGRPDPADQDSADPDSADPDSADPNSTGPPAADPDGAGPNAADPDAAGRNGTGPGAAGPDVTGPGATGPDSDPGSGTPRTKSSAPPRSAGTSPARVTARMKKAKASVRIASPQDGANVEESVTVSGEASVPAGHQVYLLAGNDQAASSCRGKSHFVCGPVSLDSDDETVQLAVVVAADGGTGDAAARDEVTVQRPAS